MSSSFEGTSPLALAALEDERRARTTTATSSTSSTTRNVSTKEDEETMKQLREELVRQQMRHDETAKMVLRLQEDVERAREEKEDLRVKSARSWQEQRDMLTALETEKERMREEGERREKNNEAELASLSTKVKQLEVEIEKEKEKTKEETVSADVQESRG